MAKLRIEDLNTDPVDNRWTLTKLRAAGYEEEWTRTCRTCGDEIEMYRHVEKGKWLLLNAVVLTPHHCDGT